MEFQCQQGKTLMRLWMLLESKSETRQEKMYKRAFNRRIKKLASQNKYSSSAKVLAQIWIVYNLFVQLDMYTRT